MWRELALHHVTDHASPLSFAGKGCPICTHQYSRWAPFLLPTYRCKLCCSSFKFHLLYAHIHERSFLLCVDWR